jgi:hypothetical protein
MSWSDGYFTGLPYTHGYYTQLNPRQIRNACLAVGLEPPVLGESFCYLELGYGQGVSVAIHAAANLGTFWGTDFNASHAAGAQHLATVSGAKAQVLDLSFSELLDRSDLPQFDVVSLHGVWSWISDENREVILQLLLKKLKVGGAVFVSYNCYPGWAPLIPIRELMSAYADRAGNVAGQEDAVARGIEFAREVLLAQPGYLLDNPTAAHQLERLGKERLTHNYIAHEYLNQDWKISSFGEMASMMERAKLGFAASAKLLNNIDTFRISPRGVGVLDKIGDQVLQEMARDCMTNEKFRCDIFVKGPRKIPAVELHNRWLEELFVLTTPLDDLPKEIPVPLGTVSLREATPWMIATLLAEDGYRPKPVREMLSNPMLAGASLDDAIRAIIVLVGAGCASPAQMPTELTIEQCRQFNRHVLKRALVSTELTYLASPVTGGGVPMPHLCQLFIACLERGVTAPPEMASAVWEVLEKLGERLRKDDQRLETREDNIACIEPLAELFVRKVLPMLSALVVV